MKESSNEHNTEETKKKSYITDNNRYDGKGRELLVAVSPKLKDKIIDEFTKSENTAGMVFKLHPEYLYELVAAYNKSNDPDISLRILIGVISAYTHSN